MTSKDRRNFLRLGAASLGALATSSFWPRLIENALAVTPNNPTGSPGLADIEHVIIFMQENRSFDHYFGAMNGVRGFGDPRPAPIPSGNYVWYQAEGTNSDSRSFSTGVDFARWTQPSGWYQTSRPAQSSHYVLPFGLNHTGNVRFQYLGGLDHSWKQSQNIWKNWDTWVPLKSRQSMGYLTASELPFYYALANAFTVCDDYHCSVFAATDPNRFYLWSGTCPPPMNFPAHYAKDGDVADITHDNNDSLTPAMFGQSAAARAAAVAKGEADWKTYAETLSDINITWKVYQEYDNYGDNYLQYFKNFRVDNTGTTIDKSKDPYFQTLYQRGRVFAAQTTNVGDALIAEFANDISAGMEPDHPAHGTVKPGLPRVSWIVAPYKFCEHPSASPGDGESLTARLLDILVNQHPDVFAKTVFMLTYDENDGYFDHVPPPVPAISADYGQMTMQDGGAAENMSSVPVGLGPRVPMLIVSPWTKGGKVSSQTSDHTSVLRFLEQWLTAKGLASADESRCALISNWRRTVCGDLTEAFDFRQPVTTAPLNTFTTLVNGTASAAVPSPQTFPALPKPHTRSACRLGYELFVHARVADGQFSLDLTNTGSVGAALIAYWMPMADAQNPYHYTIEAGKSLTAAPVAIGGDGLYDWSVHGPNGFLREFRGNVHNVKQLGQVPEVTVCYDITGGNLRLTLNNRNGSVACSFQLADNAYYRNKPVTITVAPGAEQSVDWLGSSDSLQGNTLNSGWYDIGIRVAGDPVYLRRLAGCVQPRSGALRTDPAIGNPNLFKPSIIIQGNTLDTIRFDYVCPPWLHRPKNWIAIYRKGDAQAHGGYKHWAYVPGGIGSVMLSTFTSQPLSAGDYEAWYFQDDGYAVLAGPIAFSV